LVPTNYFTASQTTDTFSKKKKTVSLQIKMMRGDEWMPAITETVFFFLENVSVV
jgi:hypothetical protein